MTGTKHNPLGVGRVWAGPKGGRWGLRGDCWNTGALFMPFHSSQSAQGAADLSVLDTVLFANIPLPDKLHNSSLHKHLANLPYFYPQQAQHLSFEHTSSQQTFPVHIEPL